LSLGDVHEGEHDACNVVLDGAVGQQAGQEVSAVRLAHFSFDGYQLFKHSALIGAELLVVQLRGQVAQRAPNVARDEVEQGHGRRRVARDAQLSVQENGGNGGGAHQVVKVAVGVPKFINFAFELQVDG